MVWTIPAQTGWRPRWSPPPGGGLCGWLAPDRGARSVEQAPDLQKQANNRLGSIEKAAAVDCQDRTASRSSAGIDRAHRKELAPKMLKRLTVLFFSGALFLSLGTASVEAKTPPGDVYDRGHFNDTYEFEYDSCSFPFEVKGRAKGSFITYNLPGSQGQAFLGHNRNRFKEVLTNPANGKKMYVSGRGYAREVAGHHVKGDVWKFDAIETGKPFVVRDANRKLVLMDRGKIFMTVLFDTLGDREPGGKFVEETASKVIYGFFPSREADFDFCALVNELMG